MTPSQKRRPLPYGRGHRCFARECCVLGLALPLLLAQILVGDDVDLDAAILRAAFRAVVARDRPLESEAHDAHASLWHAQRQEVIGHGLGAALGFFVFVFGVAVVVGVVGVGVVGFFVFFVHVRQFLF